MQSIASGLPNDQTPVRPRSAPSGPGVDSPLKAGDAVGQPRKSPVRPSYDDQYVEVDTPERVSIFVEAVSPTQSRPMTVDLTHTREQPDAFTSSAPPSPGVQTKRGTKRGPARMRLPQTSSTDQVMMASSIGLNLQVPSLLRHSSSSSSMTSSASGEGRPIKRRNEATSSLVTTGLSSPPPSRDSSIAPDETVTDKSILSSRGISAPDNRSRSSPQLSRIPKMRDLSSVVGALGSKPSPARGSFLPVKRQQSPVENLTPASKGRSSRQADMTPRRPISSNASPRKKDISSDRMGLTPSKLAMGVSSSMSRARSSTPSSCESRSENVWMEY